MKIKINGFENEIILEEDKVNILEIKDVRCFSNIIGNINEKVNYNGENNEIILLDDEDEQLKMNKECYLLLDIFNIEYTSKKILTKIYECIENNIKNNQDYEIEKQMLKVRNYLIEEINELPFEFTMKSELEISEILKLFSLKIDESSYETLLEKVEILIDILATLKIAKILIIPNLKLYMSREEIILLYKYSLYNNIRLLLIERDNHEKLNYEQIITIDENFCDYIN